MNIRRNLIAAGLVAVAGAGAFLAFRMSSGQSGADEPQAGMAVPDLPERQVMNLPQTAEGRAPLPSEGVGSYPRTPANSAKQ